MKRKICYLNTDLILRAPHDLAPLADALIHRGLFTLYAGQWADGSWSVKFETEQPFAEPDPNIAAMLTAIESLDEPCRSMWATCTLRDFDIGYECGDEPQGFYHLLSTATLARIAIANASVVIRLYPAELL